MYMYLRVNVCSCVIHTNLPFWRSSSSSQGRFFFFFERQVAKAGNLPFKHNLPFEEEWCTKGLPFEGNLPFEEEDGAFERHLPFEEDFERQVLLLLRKAGCAFRRRLRKAGSSSSSKGRQPAFRRRVKNLPRVHERQPAFRRRRRVHLCPQSIRGTHTCFFLYI